VQSIHLSQRSSDPRNHWYDETGQVSTRARTEASENSESIFRTWPRIDSTPARNSGSTRTDATVAILLKTVHCVCASDRDGVSRAAYEATSNFGRDRANDSGGQITHRQDHKDPGPSSSGCVYSLFISRTDRSLTRLLSALNHPGFQLTSSTLGSPGRPT